MTVIAVSSETASSPDAGQTAAAVMVAAVAFWLAHACGRAPRGARLLRQGIRRHDEYTDAI
jgi:hypothetical protein